MASMCIKAFPMRVRLWGPCVGSRRSLLSRGRNPYGQQPLALCALKCPIVCFCERARLRQARQEHIRQAECDFWDKIMSRRTAAF